MGCKVKKCTIELATVAPPAQQGNKRKRKTIFKQQFKGTTVLTFLYIFYYVNSSNWSIGKSRPSVTPYVTAASISKLDTFYYRNVNSLLRNESSENFVSNASIMGLPLQSAGSISLGKIVEISRDNFVNHEASTENFIMRRTPSNRFFELAKCVSPNSSHTTPTLASSRCSLSRRERVDDNKLRNTLEHFLLKWKIRKKIRNKRHVSSLKTNEIFVESIEATSVTTEATTATSFDSSQNNATDYSYLNSTDYEDDYSGAVDDDGDNILINISTITQLPLGSSTIPIATATITYPATSEYNSLARQIDPTQRAIITHFLNRFKENNVFEMATKLKYNKLSGGVTEKAKKGFGKVSLLGLFELSTRDGIRPEGRSELAAAQLAVRHINERHLLPGYTLELLTNDTKVRDTNSFFLSTFCFYLLN